MLIMLSVKIIFRFHLMKMDQWMIITFKSFPFLLWGKASNKNHKTIFDLIFFAIKFFLKLLQIKTYYIMFCGWPFCFALCFSFFILILNTIHGSFLKVLLWEFNAKCYYHALGSKWLFIYILISIMPLNFTVIEKKK